MKVAGVPPDKAPGSSRPPETGEVVVLNIDTGLIYPETNGNPPAPAATAWVNSAVIPAVRDSMTREPA